MSNVIEGKPAGYNKLSTTITSETYVQNVLRTDTPLTPELIARLQNPDTIRLLHAGMGICTEAGEFMDMLKKHIFYGRPIDGPNAVEELGDVSWYFGLACDVLQTTMNEVLTMNINKLRLRYPEKFTEHHATNRDLDAERALLETTNKYKHQYHKCYSESCYVCAGGLGFCEVCHGVEGSLTTDCCGRPITGEESDKIYKEGTLDFRNGEWVNEPNYPRTHKNVGKVSNGKRV